MKNRPIGRKGRWTCVLLLAALLLIGGCSDRGSKTVQVTSNENIKKVVTYQHYFSGSLSGGIDTMVSKLNTRSKAFEVRAVPIDHESYKVMIREALSGNNPADLYAYWAGARTASVAQNLEPLDDIWQERGLDKVFPDFVRTSACTYDGKKLLVPITQHYVAIAYNKAIFEKLGLTPPKTWQEFNKTCAKIKSAGITPIALGSKSKWPAQFWFDYLLLGTAPLEYRDKLMKGEAHYSDPEVMKAFELWKSLMDKGYFNKKPNEIDWDSGAGEMVFEGKAAMTLMGTWLTSYYGDSTHNWVMGKDYDYFAFPVLDKNLARVSLGPIDGIVIPAHSLNKKEAKSVIAYFAEIETQKAMSQGSGAFAPSQQVEASFYNEAQGRLLRVMREAPNWAFNYDLSTPPEAADAGLNAFVDFLEFPDDYKMILESTDLKMRKLFVKP